MTAQRSSRLGKGEDEEKKSKKSTAELGDHIREVAAMVGVEPGRKQKQRNLARPQLASK